IPGRDGSNEIIRIYMKCKVVVLAVIFNDLERDAHHYNKSYVLTLVLLISVLVCHYVLIFVWFASIAQIVANELLVTIYYLWTLLWMEQKTTIVNLVIN
ncbi:hypothetical protein ACJX0J_018667, partial [Zea mays]